MEAFGTLVSVFLAAAVECVEAWTIVVAVGLTRGWRAPLLGTAAAAAVIGGLIAAFGVTLVDRIDEQLFELVVGTLLVLFGLRWLRKAVLRDAGVIGLHDEDRIYATKVAALRAAGRPARFDWVGFVTAGKTMLLEGLEITFLVITLGSDGTTSFAIATAGAAAAFVVVGVAGLLARRPLSKVPENMMKRLVGIMLCAFGTFWAAEGLGVAWPGAAWGVIYLFATWATVAALAARVVRESLATDVLAASQ